MKDTFEEILVSEAVHREILAGRGLSRTDVPVLISAMEEGWIKVRKDARSSRKLPNYLGEGEKQTILLMKKEKTEWLFIDDRIAREVAISLGLEPRYSVYLLPFWVNKDRITKSTALDWLDGLVETGYYLKAQHFLAVRDLINSLP